VDLVVFAIAAAVIPGVLSGAFWELVVCALLFAVVSGVVRPLVPYLTCPVVLLTVPPAWVLLNSLVVWAAVTIARMLGLGIEARGIVPIVLIACVVGAGRMIAALAAHAAQPWYGVYAARKRFREMDRARIWYRKQLDSGRPAEGTTR
jgi:uncharacterized membrane protein YvlD (DUF360 family)